MIEKSNALTLIGLGDLVADIVVTIPSLPVEKDDFILANDFSLEAGGTSNFLITASRLGASAVAFGSLGDDVWGREVASILRSEKVDLSPLSPSGSTTRSLVLVDDSGSHTFIGKFGSGTHLRLDDEKRKNIQNTDAVFASGYSLREEHLVDLTLEVMRFAGETDVLRSFDPGPAFAGLPSDIQAAILGLTEILFLTREELEVVSPKGLSPLFSRGIKTIVLKLGMEGCEVHTSSGKVIKEEGLAVEVRDTTAAGDSFAAAFLRAFCSDMSLESSLLFANVVGAAKVQKLGGGRNVPTREEVQKLIDRFELDLSLAF